MDAGRINKHHLAFGLGDYALILNRVVCGLSETAAIFWPTSRFSSVDFPAFGRPIRATYPL